MREDRKKAILEILDGSPSRLRESFFDKNYTDLKKSIDDFCINIENISFKEKMWHWTNEIDVPFTCKCGKGTTFNKNWLDGYRQYCSPKCAQSDKATKDKRQKTTLEKYGVTNVAKNSNIKKKAEETNLERYGTKSSFQNEDVKEKWKKNIKEKYGVDHISQLEIFKEKRRESILEKYGKEHFSQTEEYKNMCVETNNLKYGVDWYTQTDDYKEKTLITNLEKHGVTHYSKTNEYKDIVKKTNLDRYGAEWYCQSSDFKEKKKETNIERYGVDHHTKSSDYNEKIKLMNIEKHGVDNIQKSEIYRKKTYDIAKNPFYIKYIDSSLSLFNCDCGNEHTFEIYVDNYIKRNKENNPLCTICHPISAKSSIKEKVLYEFIESTYSGEIIPGYRDGLEIDIYLPELKLGFEFNGLYWHSNKYKEKSYHIDKTNYFLDKEIRIVHIWEDDWIFRREIVESQISNLVSNKNIKIFARKCNIAEVDTKESSSFLEENHIQGKVNSSLKLGLYHNGKLVSLMTFDHFEGRHLIPDNEWNLNRFCSSKNTNVVGGASKLFEHFIKNYKPSRVISYADRDWSIGNLYYKLGFKKIGESLPDYKYLVDGRRVHKSRYKKTKTKTTLTESRYAIENNMLKIYDCGKIKFEKDIIENLKK